MSDQASNDERALELLRLAVAEALERKRRLGQYAVIWHNGRPVRIGGDADQAVHEERGEIPAQQ